MKLSIEGQGKDVMKLLKGFRTHYLHTLDGQPASFYKSDGVCFTHSRARLVPTLRQLRAEQRQSIEIRTRKGLREDSTYGYVTVLASKA